MGGGGNIEIEIIEMKVVALFQYKDVMGDAVKSIFVVAEVRINSIFILFSGILYYLRTSLFIFLYAREWRIGHDKNYLI